MGFLDNLTGRKFGRLLVLTQAPKRPHQRLIYWVCRCDCGVVREFCASNLRAKVSQSCGCLARELMAKRRRSHGHTCNEKGYTPEYTAWLQMKQRCVGKYLSKGISVSLRWGKFNNFLADMGNKPSAAHSLDRKDNAKGYTRNNCRWATAKQQARNKSNNRRVSLNGKTQTLSEWAEELNLNYNTLKNRLRIGFSPAQALQKGSLRSWQKNRKFSVQKVSVSGTFTSLSKKTAT